MLHKQETLFSVSDQKQSDVISTQTETYENLHTSVTPGSYCETEGTQTPFVTFLGRKSKGVESEKQI